MYTTIDYFFNKISISRDFFFLFRLNCLYPVDFFLRLVQNLQVLLVLTLPTNFASILDVFLTKPFKTMSVGTVSDAFEVYSNSKAWTSSSIESTILNSGEELSSSMRRVKANNPVVGYSFKVGDFYPSTTISIYPSIFRSLSDITRGVRRSS